MRIVIANDKVAFELKKAIVKKLHAEEYDVVDYGTMSSEEPCSHTEAATRVTRSIRVGEADRGILLCGTGAGVAIAANKYQGIYAVVAESVYAARRCRLINDCNVLCLGAYILGEPMALEMVDAFLTTGFAENFEEKRAENLKRQRDIITEIEKDNFK